MISDAEIHDEMQLCNTVADYFQRFPKEQDAKRSILIKDLLRYKKFLKIYFRAINYYEVGQHDQNIWLKIICVFTMSK